MKGAIVDMFADEMVLNVYMLCTLVKFCCCGKSNHSSIVKKNPNGGLEWE